MNDLPLTPKLHCFMIAAALLLSGWTVLKPSLAAETPPDEVFYVVVDGNVNFWFITSGVSYPFHVEGLSFPKTNFTKQANSMDGLVSTWFENNTFHAEIDARIDRTLQSGDGDPGVPSVDAGLTVAVYARSSTQTAFRVNGYSFGEAHAKINPDSSMWGINAGVESKTAATSPGNPDVTEPFQEQIAGSFAPASGTLITVDGQQYYRILTKTISADNQAWPGYCPLQCPLEYYQDRNLFGEGKLDLTLRLGETLPQEICFKVRRPCWLKGDICPADQWLKWQVPKKCLEAAVPCFDSSPSWPGHAWVELRTRNGVIDAQGWYPAYRAQAFFSLFGFPAIGEFRDDFGTPCDLEICFPITDEQVEEFWRAKGEWESGDRTWGIGGWVNDHCLTYVHYIADRLGLPLPDDIWVPHTTWRPPEQFYDVLHELLGIDPHVSECTTLQPRALARDAEPIEISGPSVAVSLQLNPQSVATRFGLRFSDETLSDIALGLGGSLEVDLSGFDLSRSLITIDWGDSITLNALLGATNRFDSPGKFPIRIIAIDNFQVLVRRLGVQVSEQNPVRALKVPPPLPDASGSIGGPVIRGDKFHLFWSTTSAILTLEASGALPFSPSRIVELPVVETAREFSTMEWLGPNMFFRTLSHPPNYRPPPPRVLTGAAGVTISAQKFVNSPALIEIWQSTEGHPYSLWATIDPEATLSVTFPPPAGTRNAFVVRSRLGNTVSAMSLPAIFTSSQSLLADSSFEFLDQGQGPSAFTIDPVGGPWNFVNTSGVTSLPSRWDSKTAQSGHQVAFLQGANSAIAQQFSVASDGDYRLSFFEAGRTTGTTIGGDTHCEVTMGSKKIGSFVTSGSDADSFSRQDIYLPLTAGAHDLSFRVISADNPQHNGDDTALLDSITLTRIVNLIADEGFELIDQGEGPSAFTVRPTGGTWQFGPNGLNSGITSLPSRWDPRPALFAHQVAFLQGVGATVSQTFSVGFPGSYTVRFFAAGRSETAAVGGNTEYAVVIDSQLAAKFSTTSGQPFEMKAAPLTLTEGNHTITFQVLSVGSTHNGDETLFLDSVRIER